MHTLGKVFAFLVVVAAIAAAVLTSKLVVVRNSWTAKSVALRKKTTADIPKIEALELKIDGLKSEIFRSRELWGDFWGNVETRIMDPAQGILLVNIGSRERLSPELAIHGFELGPDGTSIYRGSFSPLEIADGNATLKPNWRATPEDVADWKPGIWRWRNAIPSGYTENIDGQFLAILAQEETLADRRRTLSGQNVLLEQANSGLKLREAELVGGAELEKSPTVTAEFRDGLVPTIEQTEEDRNKTLEKVDELRRKVRQIQEEIDGLKKDNTALVRKLPGGAPTEARK